MSLHPSLKIDSAGTQQRSVLSRIERIKDLMQKDLWKDGQSVIGLPKTKIIKIKTVSKEKKEEGTEEGEAKGEGAAETTAEAPKEEDKKK